MVVVGVKRKWGETLFLGSLVKKGLQKENSISESSGGAGGGGGGRGTIFVVTKKGRVVGDFWSFVCLFFFLSRLSSLLFLQNILENCARG